MLSLQSGLVAFLATPTLQVIKTVKINSAGTSRKISELRDSCQDLEGRVKRAKTDHTAQITASTGSVSATHDALLTSGENVPQQAHLREIFDARCQCDVVTLEYCHEREELLQALQQVRSQELARCTFIQVLISIITIIYNYYLQLFTIIYIACI